MNKNEVYRARINSSNEIEVSLIFKIPLNLSDSNIPQVLDVVVADNFTIVRYDNFTLATYFRPKALGGLAVLSKSGSLQLKSDSDEPIYFFLQSNATNQQFYLYFAANSVSNNLLIQYHIY